VLTLLQEHIIQKTGQIASGLLKLIRSDFQQNFKKLIKTELNSAFTGIFYYEKYLNPGAYLKRETTITLILQLNIVMEWSGL